MTLGDKISVQRAFKLKIRLSRELVYIAWRHITSLVTCDKAGAQVPVRTNYMSPPELPKHFFAVFILIENDYSVFSILK